MLTPRDSGDTPPPNSESWKIHCVWRHWDAMSLMSGRCSRSSGKGGEMRSDSRAAPAVPVRWTRTIAYLANSTHCRFCCCRTLKSSSTFSLPWLARLQLQVEIYSLLPHVYVSIFFLTFRNVLILTVLDFYKKVRVNADSSLFVRCLRNELGLKTNWIVHFRLQNICQLNYGQWSLFIPSASTAWLL